MITGRKHSSQAFTLVELIVTITILAILGSIAYVSFLGYTLSARDSVRISDLKVISKALELYATENDIYPQPSGEVAITFSGSTIWSQGTVGQSVIQQVRRLTSVPLDPLTQTEYTYSRTYKNNEYELGALFEGDGVVQAPLYSQTVYANGTNIGKAYVIGQYNGKVINIQIDSNYYVLAVPTIINGDLSVTDIEQLITDGKLVLKGQANLPASYSGSIYNTLGGGNLNAVDPNHFVVFSGSLDELTGSDSQPRKDLVLNLQQAYSGSITDTSGANGGVSQLLSVDDTNDNQIEQFASIMVQNDLGAGVVASNGNQNNGGNQNQGGGGGSVTITFPGGDQTVACSLCY